MKENNMMEQIYNEFTTKLLPKINEGLIITQEYFADLFVRYIKYLLITDIIKLLIMLIIFIILFILAIKFIPKTWTWVKEECVEPIMMLWLFALFIFIPIFIEILEKTEDIVKDIYLPEVRIYEEITNFIGKDNQ